MQHDEKIKIAKELCKKIVSKYKVHYVGIYGSTARNEDTNYSDLEMVIASKDKDWWGTFRVKGMSVWLHFMPLEKVYEQVSWVEPEGSSFTNNFLNSLTLYDKINLKDEIRKRFRKINYSKFQNAALVPLGEVNDNIAKMRNAIMKRGKNDALILERFILLEQADAVVALLNKKYFTRGGMDHLLDIKKFKYVPRGYLKLSKIIWTTNNTREVIEAAITLSNLLTKFAEKHGVKIASYSSTKEWRGV